MNSIFTEFLRGLDEGMSPPDPQTFDQLWKTLRHVLAGEMKRRSVWSSPPSFLGVFGWTRWSELDAHPEPTADGGALEELLAECYSFIFVHRLRALRTQLARRRDIDGLIFLNVRHFLHDTQKRFDPLGFQVFTMVREAVRRGVESGELHVLEGDPRVRNETILGFRSGCDPTEAEHRELARLVPAWNDTLLPELVTARGKERERLALELRALLATLPENSVRAFRFKDLVDAFKTDVRGRWASLFDRSQGESGLGGYDGDEADPHAIVRIVPPDDRFAERDAFEKLVDCIETLLEKLTADPSTHTYLTRLWRFLCAQAAEWSENQGSGGDEVAVEVELLSRRKLAELLRIPRDRLPGLYRQLGQLLETCRQTGSSPSRFPKAVTGEQHTAATEEP